MCDYYGAVRIDNILFSMPGITIVRDFLEFIFVGQGPHLGDPTFWNPPSMRHVKLNSGIESSLVLSHIRKATTGPIELRNTHPFTREIHGRLHSFAFNGNVPGVFNLGLTLGQFSPIGETDGEFAFCWLLEQLGSQVDNDDWKHTASILKSLGEQLATLGPANFLYSDSQHLYAFASKRCHSDGLHPPGLYHNTRHCDQQQHSIPCVGLSIQSVSVVAQALTLVASVPLSDETWVPFEENQLLVIENGEILSAN